MQLAELEASQSSLQSKITALETKGSKDEATEAAPAAAADTSSADAAPAADSEPAAAASPAAEETSSSEATPAPAEPAAAGAVNYFSSFNNLKLTVRSLFRTRVRAHGDRHGGGPCRGRWLRS